MQRSVICGSRKAEEIIWILYVLLHKKLKGTKHQRQNLTQLIASATSACGQAGSLLPGAAGFTGLPWESNPARSDVLQHQEPETGRGQESRQRFAAFSI